MPSFLPTARSDPELHPFRPGLTFVFSTRARGRLRPFRAATYRVNLIDLRHLGAENPQPAERVDPGAETRD
jgi:hypothetical protein